MRVRLMAILAASMTVCLAVLSPAAAADEGMWTFEAFPSARVKAAYGFAPDRAWLERVQKASVRLEGGCSGSVVSKAGLVLTNHHCIRACIDALSTDRSDLSARGFLAVGRADERVCPGMEASILQSVTDVTARMQAASAGLDASEVAGARAAARVVIEQEACAGAKTDACQLVTLYNGGRFMLYRYTLYQDVRLVFAPEFQAAFFGGDPDNYNFPRYALDMALLRLYRDGAPVRFRDPLRIDPAGPIEGDLVFTSGHPGGTERLLTVSELEFQRDHFLPWRIEYLAQIRGSLLAVAQTGEEEARQTRDAIFSIENAVKVQRGRRQSLVQEEVLARKRAQEQQLRDALAADAGLRATYGDPFLDMDTVRAAEVETWLPWEMLEARLGAGSTLLADARTIVRGGAERKKPSAQRLPEFVDARLPAVARRLTAETVVHPVLERLEVEFWLLKTRELLGPDHPAVRALFDGKSAAQLASEIAANSRLVDPSYRQKLWSDPSALEVSSDPAIQMVRRLDSYARLARSEYETRVTSPKARAAERIAHLRFAVLGDTVYPDATFTLRLSYGVVKGWLDPQHGAVPAFTFVEGLLRRATGSSPFDLTPRWSSGAARIEEGTPMNMVSTNDTVGGHSGSPLVNRKGQIVGLVFDGNIHSVGGHFGYDEALNRTVSVASPMLIAALRTIYAADVLIDEMLRG